MARNDEPAAMVDTALGRLSDGQEHIRAFGETLRPDTAKKPTHDDLGGLAPRTVATYIDNSRRFEAKTGQPLTAMSTEDVTDGIDALDLAPQSVTQYAAALKAFYRWHDDAVDAERIDTTTDSSEPGIDVDRVPTTDQFHAIREATDNPRDRAIVDLLGYTGQRIRVIQTLRVGDVFPEQGRTGLYRPNPQADGLKGARKVQDKRPLLGAKGSVRDWLEYHPTGDPDHYLITPLRNASRGDPSEPVGQNTIRRAVHRAAERAGLIELDGDRVVSSEVDTNPHAFRHLFATIAYRDYDIDPDIIKRLLGHGEGSRIMETTYRHLGDEDIISDAEAGFLGEDAEAEPENPMTPPVCPTCGRALDGHKECPRCGERFGPDAEARADTIPVEELDAYQSEVFAGMFEQFSEATGVEIDIDAEDVLAEAKSQRRALGTGQDDLAVAEDQ